jgi:lactoylglutathione lyase
MHAKFGYTGIRVKDLDESVRFYTSVLGMKEAGRSRIDETQGEVASLVSAEGGPVLELNHYARGSRFDTPYQAGEGLDHLAFQVPDLDEALAEASRSGHPPVLDIKTKTSRWAYIRDPNGIFIELYAG